MLRVWNRLVKWLARSQIDGAFRDGSKHAYSNATIVCDLGCVSMNAYYRDKTKRECFDDLRQHFERCRSALNK